MLYYNSIIIKKFLTKVSLFYKYFFSVQIICNCKTSMKTDYQKLELLHDVEVCAHSKLNESPN